VIHLIGKGAPTLAQISLPDISRQSFIRHGASVKSGTWICYGNNYAEWPEYGRFTGWSRCKQRSYGWQSRFTGWSRCKQRSYSSINSIIRRYIVVSATTSSMRTCSLTL
jgi:hypothetical protein